MASGDPDELMEFEICIAGTPRKVHGEGRRLSRRRQTNEECLSSSTTVDAIGTFKAGRISHLASRISHLMGFVMIEFKFRSGSHEPGNSHQS